MKFKDLKILSDENISPKVIAFLRNKDIDVLDVKEEGWHGKNDDELLEIGFRTQRFVMTHDSDFGALAIHEGKSCFGIIYLRLKNQHYTNVIKVYENLLLQKTEIFTGALVVVQEEKIRIRWLNDNYD